MIRYPWTRLVLALFLVGSGLACGVAQAADASGAARPESVPLTRDDMKRALDASKESVPRLQLPPVTDEEKALIEEQKAKAAQAGEKPRRLGLANNGRMRAYYLADYGYGRSNDLERARTGANRDANSSFDPAFRTMLFWIVSRGNNCTYCLGHQESGLASRGITDDQLAALDGDWSEFAPARRAAFAFATKLSFQPYALTDADFAALRAHYSDEQMLEIVLAVAGFNATNRWTGPLRIKQDVLFQFVRPTSPKYVPLVSRVAPIDTASSAQGFAAPCSRPRPPLETRTEVAAALEAARKRTPRFKLGSDAEATELVKAPHGSGGHPQWIRLIATLPKAGAERAANYQATLNKGTLDPRLKAIIAYIGARHDRAWYALGHALERLKAQGFQDAQIAALDQPEKLSDPAEREVALFARKITLDPALIDDDDFARMRKLFDDKRVAEVVYLTTQAAFFDRLTEAARLQLESNH